MFGHMKDPVEGTATLVSYLEYPGAVGGKNDMVLRSQLVVQGPGLPPTPGEAAHSARQEQLPRAPGPSRSPWSSWTTAPPPSSTARRGGPPPRSSRRRCASSRVAPSPAMAG